MLFSYIKGNTDGCCRIKSLETILEVKAFLTFGSKKLKDYQLWE